MRITVRVKPGSKLKKVRQLAPNEYEIAVIERPEKGRATDAARRALAETLDVPPSRVSLVMGQASRVKVFEIK